MAYIENATCYKHGLNFKPVSYQVCVDPMTGSRSGSCPSCKKEQESMKTAANTGKALNWLEMSAGYTHL